jgi:HemY protein
MLRFLFLLPRLGAALAIIVAVVAASVFFADHPGHVEIDWEGRQIGGSFGLLVGAAAVLALLAALLALLGAALLRIPGNFRRRRAARRQRDGEAATTRGLVALAAGQPAEAQRDARRAAALLGPTPITLLLAAEAAQQQGDAATARAAYMTMLERPDIEFLALRGLIGQAIRAGDDAAALRLAERAWRLRPDAGWLGEHLLLLQARTGDWDAVRSTLAGAARRSYGGQAARMRHHQGVAYDELSRAAEQRGEMRRAAAYAAKAQAQAPDLAAIAAHHARLLLGLGRRRAAGKAIERAWRSAPHPDLARLYLDAQQEAEPLTRATALQRLAARNPEAAESRLAIAEAALAAQLWGEARRHLTLAVAAAPPPGPSRRLCLLMARLEESETGDAIAARNWLDRAIGAPPDPCYACAQCGHERMEWLALCPDCGGFDTLAWQTAAPKPRSLLTSSALTSSATGGPLVLPAP